MPDVSELEPVGIRARPEAGASAEADVPVGEEQERRAVDEASAAPHRVAPFGGQGGRSEEISRVLQIPLKVHVELGRRRMRISDLLALEPGSVLELDAASNAPLAIYANRTLVARGEAVVVGGHYGVRITEIVSPEERALRLGGVGARSES